MGITGGNGQGRGPNARSSAPRSNAPRSNAPRSSAPRTNARTNGPRPNGSRPAGSRPTVSPRPVNGRPNRRYAPQPSPKRPRSYRRSGCSNIAIGGVVVGIVLFIVLLLVIRHSCTGCVKDTESDVSNITSSVPDSSVSDSTPSASTTSSSGSTTSSYIPPKPAEPVIPVLTLEKNNPLKAFKADCVIDELQWFNDTKATGESLRFVYDKLGIQPYVVFKKYDSSLKTDDDKVKYCVDWYKDNINDDDTFLLMYFAEKASGSDVGYTVYYSGANAERLAAEFKWILEDGMNEYWFTEMSTDDVIKYAFEYTCDRITIKSEVPSTSSSDETSTGSSEETSDT